ncbi:hypothetical protein BJ912DRAFT_958513 [Pholiota molesta]|nr:hypothetical protein BJ912DRAFT_958513 [Pholiota molesta]
MFCSFCGAQMLWVGVGLGSWATCWISIGEGRNREHCVYGDFFSRQLALAPSELCVALSRSRGPPRPFASWLRRSPFLSPIHHWSRPSSVL